MHPVRVAGRQADQPPTRHRVNGGDSAPILARSDGPETVQVPRRGAGGGRDGFPQEGHDLGGAAAPVLRWVQRQYSATTGMVDRRLGVFLAYASLRGRAMIDWELYLRCWTDDPERCRAARVPEQVGFRTKPQLAQLML